MSNKKIGPHIHESLKYIVIIAILGLIAAGVVLMYFYKIPPFFGETSKNVIRLSETVPVEYINNVNLFYRDNSANKDNSKPDKYNEQYAVTINIVGLGLIPTTSSDPSQLIPNNYRDYFQPL